MLIISRRKNQKLMVGDEVEITILEVGRTRVRFGIKAPQHVHIASRIKGTEQPPLDVADEQTDDPDGNDGSTIAGVTSISSHS